MATLERYNSFEEFKNSELAVKISKKKALKNNLNTIKEFALLLGKNVIPTPKTTDKKPGNSGL